MHKNERCANCGSTFGALPFGQSRTRRLPANNTVELAQKKHHTHRTPIVKAIARREGPTDRGARTGLSRPPRRGGMEAKRDALLAGNASQLPATWSEPEPELELQLEPESQPPLVPRPPAQRTSAGSGSTPNPRAEVPWRQAVQSSRGAGSTPRQLRRRMRAEEKSRASAARRGTVKLKAAVGMMGMMMREQAFAASQAAKAAEEQAERAARSWAISDAVRRKKLDAASVWAASQARAQKQADEDDERDRLIEEEKNIAEAERRAQAATAQALRVQAAAELAAIQAEEAAEAAARAEAPWGWELQRSASTGDRYFFNTITGDCQWDTPLEDAWGLEEVPAELAAGQSWVQVSQTAGIRRGVMLDSDLVGQAQPGELLYVLEFSHVPSGRGLRRARVRCYGGWLSVTARDGSVAVQLADAPPVAVELASVGKQLPSLLSQRELQQNQERLLCDSRSSGNRDAFRHRQRVTTRAVLTTTRFPGLTLRDCLWLQSEKIGMKISDLTATPMMLSSPVGQMPQPPRGMAPHTPGRGRAGRPTHVPTLYKRSMNRSNKGSGQNLSRLSASAR